MSVFEFVHPGVLYAFVVTTAIALVVQYKHINPGFNMASAVIFILTSTMLLLGTVPTNFNFGGIIEKVVILATTTQLVFAVMAFVLRDQKCWKV
ncbi:MAG: hypothetical protein RSG77_09870 [Hafnia sp.]